MFYKQTMDLKKYILLGLILLVTVAFPQKEEKNNKNENNYNISGLKFRSIGPSVASGRIADIAVNPVNFSERYIAVASGNVWKTTNAGLTWNPIFDSYKSYSTSDVEIDPNNPNIIWVGTGEYNSQRAIGFGDGIYISFDGGKSFKNVGLTKSEHIGRIAIDPRNSNVYVASQGPLWGAGGERGLYKTTNYGKTWDKILDISENTGINDIIIDSKNPDILYASSYQRRRHVYTLINGGEEATIYKSTDAGKTWNKIENGLPVKKMGRIGLAISPINSNYIYAIVEAQEDKGGIFRSTDAGASWIKMSSYIASSPQYYNRLYCDPIELDKIYSMDTYSRYSTNGGKTWTKLGLKEKHVDDHCLWINPNNTKQLMIGCDGGLYETFDFGENWRHIENLPITQFYRVEADNDYPFYNVYGGTQDNNTLGGPSRTLSGYGIINGNWFTTVGGDGFQTRIDPKDPNTIYSQAQYGWLVRYNKLNGEKISIQPQPPVDEAYRWNWNAPLIISPHNHKRLYFAANRLFKSEDQGNSWEVISPDLTRQLDRNQIKVMGKLQTPEAVAKNASTSLYGNIVYIDESPLKEGLIYVGTDDGLIQITEDGGQTWKKTDSFNGVPEKTYVSSVRASQHDENIVYATFDGRKNNDFNSYIFKSSDKGKTWTSISGEIKDRNIAYTIVEDFIDAKLLFVGTEFGIFFSNNGGQKWQQIKNGLPTIPIKDISIQKRESDLVLATFGRGFYILDDYSPLRNINKAKDSDYYIFPIKDALQFIQAGHLYGQGATYYKGENPKMGVTFSYFVKEKPKSLKDIRIEKNKDLKKENKDEYYPSFEELTSEDLENKSYLLFIIKDKENNIIKQIPQSIQKGLHRFIWDMKVSSTSVIYNSKAQPNSTKSNQLAPAGSYSVSLFLMEQGQLKNLNLTENFRIKNFPETKVEEHNEMYAFQKKLQIFEKEYSVFINQFNKSKKNINKLFQAYHTANTIDIKLYSELIDYKQNMDSLNILIFGNSSISKRNGNQSPSLNDRYSLVNFSTSSYTGNPTQTSQEQFDIVQKLYTKYKKIFTQLELIKTNNLKNQLQKIGAVNISE